MDDSRATAYEAWDRRWASEAGRADWLTPEPDAVRFAAAMAMRGLARALDLGCGVGRHARFLAARGFDVVAVDAAPEGLAFARRETAAAGLAVDYRAGLMTAVPVEDASVDAVVAWNVIYHGDPAVVRAALAEIARVLRPGGLLLATMLSKRNAKFGRGRAVAEDTFVIDEEEEKAHAHFYCDAAGLVRLLDGTFEPLELADRVHREPGSYHWHLVAARR